MQQTEIALNNLEINKGQIGGLPKNPRFIRDERFEKLKKSIQDDPEMLKLRELIVYPQNSKFVVIGGNMRLRAMKDLGFKEAPCKVLPIDTPAQKLRAYTQKDNIAYGDFSFDDLMNDWDATELEDWGVELPEFEAEAETLEAKEDDYEAPEEIKTDIVQGDLIEIGQHRLLCGDSTDSDAVAKLMNGERAELLFTSPPYNAGSLNIKNNKGTHKKYQNYNDTKSSSEYVDFILSNIDVWTPHVCEIFYNVGMVEGNKRELNKILVHYNYAFKDVIYWQKKTAAPHIQPGVINNKMELIWCFGYGKRKFKNAQFHQGSYWNVIEGGNAAGNEYADIHKATFPIYLPENIINNFSNPGAIITDCFIGSGTTMVAAHQLNRKCYGMEMDEKYCQVIVDRMLKLEPDLKITINGKEYNHQNTN